MWPPLRPKNRMTDPDTNHGVVTPSNTHQVLDNTLYSPHSPDENSGFCISIELVFSVSQILATVAVLLVSRHEKPRSPLLIPWVLGYTAGCAANLPLIYSRYLQPNVASGQASCSQLDRLKMALDCFFAIWFVIGNVWIFDDRFPASEAPNLYRLCMAYLTLSCVGCAVPFVLRGIVSCCMPCLISMLGIHEGRDPIEGAMEESINVLPSRSFQLGKIGSESSAEDVACCICLASYAINDELKELPCSHFFHAECVGRWLRINASCPLCKHQIG